MAGAAAPFEHLVLSAQLVERNSIAVGYDHSRPRNLTP
jgi:hypothetical protein